MKSRVSHIVQLTMLTLLFTSIIPLLTFSQHDYIIFKSQDTLPCLNISISNLPEGTLYFTNAKGIRDTLRNAYDTISEVYTHKKRIVNFENDGFFWHKSSGIVDLYEQQLLHFWAKPEWDDLIIKPQKQFTHPTVMAGPKTEMQTYWILVYKGDTIRHPRKKILKQIVFPLVQAQLHYFEKDKKHSKKDFERLIKVINQKNSNQYEYFINRKKDTVFCRAILHEIQHGSLFRFSYTDDYDAPFFIKGKRKCLSIGSFKADNIAFSLLDHRFINKKFFYHGHFWLKREGKIKLFYYGKMNLIIHPRTEAYISRLESKNIIQLPEGDLVEFTQENFDHFIRARLNLNTNFKNKYKDKEIVLNDYIIDEMISFFNLNQQKSLTENQQGL